LTAAIQTSTITNVDVMTDGISTDGTKTDTDVTSVLTANGVTALTGMGLDNRGYDQYTTEVTAFNGDGTRLLSTNVITTEGVVYSGSNFQDWFAGLNSGGAGTGTAIQGDDSLTYACTFDPISIAGQTITITSTSGPVYILDQNGQKVYIIGENDRTILTLTDTTDLALFTPGDVVQVDGVAYTYSAAPDIVTGDPFAALNGKISTYTLNQASSITFTYPQPVNFSTINKWSGGSNAINVNYTIEFTDQNGDVVSGSATTTQSYAVSTLPVSPPTLVKSFKITGNDGYAFLGFYDNSGTFVATGKLGTDVSVISTNLATPSITTDGGAWTGSDGTSSGDVADRETKVTGPVKTTEVAGPYLTLSSSSGRWLVTETGLQHITET
jgi:hypothetical protein